MLVLSILLLFLIIGAVSANDETSNETLNAPTSSNMDVNVKAVQSTDTADEYLSTANNENIMSGNDENNNDTLSQSELKSSEDAGSLKDLDKKIKETANY